MSRKPAPRQPARASRSNFFFLFLFFYLPLPPFLPSLPSHQCQVAPLLNPKAGVLFSGDAASVTPLNPPSLVPAPPLPTSSLREPNKQAAFMLVAPPLTRCDPPDRLSSLDRKMQTGERVCLPRLRPGAPVFSKKAGGV